MKISQVALLASLAFGSSFAQAAPVFSDNFDSYTGQLNWPGAGGWSVSDGTVDIIPVNGQFDFLPGNGNYVDLDGSTSNAGLFTNSVSLLAGNTYTLSFDLAGNARGGSETVDVFFGTSSSTLVLNQNDPFQTYSLSFSAITSGVVSFGFQNQGGNNIGALLDNVTVAAVPEPDTYAMVLAGLGLMGFVARRRKT